MSVQYCNVRDRYEQWIHPTSSSFPLQLVVLRDPNEEVDDILRAHRSRERQYAFDHAFGAQSSQEDVYRVTARGLIDGVLRGINSTVFAYGPTGAGKTFTMLGKGREAGIMGLTLGDLYRHIDGKAEEMRYTVTISYLEVRAHACQACHHHQHGQLYTSGSVLKSYVVMQGDLSTFHRALSVFCVVTWFICWYTCVHLCTVCVGCEWT